MAGTFRRTVELLRDFMDRDNRDTWLTQAFFSEHRDIYSTIDQSGSPSDFTSRCIKVLDKAGCIAGRHTVSLLIEEVKRGVGSDRQGQFDELVSEWDYQCSEQAEEAPSSTPKSLSSSGDSGKEQDNGGFDVFLCHNSEDKPEVKGIGQRLKQQGLRPWLDERELWPGLPWQQLLEEQIENISSAAVFVGLSGMGPWQRRELEAFLNESVERGCPVIPIILPGASKKPR